MANILLKNRWTRQPTAPVGINGGHWAANALVSAVTFNFNFDHKQNTHLVKTGTPETLVSPAATQASAKTGVGLSMYSASTSNYLTRAYAPDLNISKIIVVARAASVSSSNNSYIAIRDYDGVSVPWALFFDASFAVGSGNCGFAFFDGGWRSTTGSNIRQTGMRTVCGTYDGATLKAFVDGVLDSQNAYSGSLPTSSTRGIDYGRYGNESTVFNGYLESCLVFDGSKIPVSDFDYAAKALSNEFYAIFQPVRRRAFFGPPAGGGGDISVALTGQGLAAAQGSFAVALERALSGQFVTVNQGILVPAIDKALTGQSNTVSQGTLSVATSVTPSGQSVTISQGSFTPAIDKALTGQSSTVSQGSVVPDVGATLSGQSVTVSQGSFTPSIQVVLTGQFVTINQGTLSVSTGTDVTLELTGQSVTVSQGTLTAALEVALGGQVVTISQGTFVPELVKAITGQSASVSQGTLVVETGPILSGQALVISQGTFGPEISVSVTGQTVTVSLGSMTPSIPGGMTTTRIIWG